MTKQKILDTINATDGYNKHNGIKIVDFGEGCCTVEGELTKDAMNPMGMAHGGFVYSLCDVASGFAVGTRGCSCVTLSSNMSYLRPSTGKLLRAEGKIIKLGKTVAFVEVNVYNDEGKHTARGEFQFFVTHGGAAKGE